jgi:serine protease Do
LAAISPVRAQVIDLKPVSASERAKLYDDVGKEASAAQGFGTLLKKIVKLTKPTVIHIEADKETSGRHVEEAGSGVIVELSGKHYAVTNRHVIRDTENSRIRVKLSDGREIRPSRTWSDQDTDLAVMQINAEALVGARLGDSDQVDIGDFVLAVGSPFGLTHSVTFGIVSARNRRNLSLGDEGLKYQDFIQTDAAINPGNSGGPLLNLRGEVIGINTAIATNNGKNEGVGFAIPSNMVTMVVRQLVERGSVRRAFLGVNLDRNYGPATAARYGLPRPVGALVSSVTPSSPAESAKIQTGDIILSFNGRDVDDDNHLVNLVSLTPVGNEVPVVIYRDKKEVKLRVKVGDKSEYVKP